jgi:hypothetical protein
MSLQPCTWKQHSYHLAVPIILIPLIWLAATTLVVAACQVAARGDACQPSSTVGEEALDERAVLDQCRARGHTAVATRRFATARERRVMLDHGR